VRVRMGKALDKRNGSGWSFLRCPTEFPAQNRRSDGKSLWQLDLSRNVRRSKANRLKIFIDPTLGIIRCPTGRVLEQTDRANLSIGATVEPVPHPLRQ